MFECAKARGRDGKKKNQSGRLKNTFGFFSDVSHIYLRGLLPNALFDQNFHNFEEIFFKIF